MTHRTAARRREAKERKRPRRPETTLGPEGWQIMGVDPGPPLGPDVTSASLAELAGAINGLSADLAWDDVAASVLPLFPRARPYMPGPPEHLLAIVPPGLHISVGIDIGPAFVHVTESMVESWSIPFADVTARAMANLHERAASVQPTEVVWEAIDSVETGWLQTHLSVASTLVLAPHELARILGTEARLIVAPMRDLIICLPPRAVELAAWLFSEIAVQDPHHLQPRLYRFDGRDVTVGTLGM